VSVLISAFNALTLSPALSALLLRPRGEDAGALRQARGRFNRWFGGRRTGTWVGQPPCSIRKLAIPLVLLAGVTGLTVLPRRQASRRASCPTKIRGTRSSAFSSPTARRSSARARSTRRSTRSWPSSRGSSTYNGIAGYSFFTRTAASYTGTGFVGLAPWDERKGPELNRRRDRRRGSTRSSRGSPRHASSRSRRRPFRASAPPAASA
jgi:HAE1 family hydrophobic/amphiphilic exporter-1